MRQFVQGEDAMKIAKAKTDANPRNDDFQAFFYAEAPYSANQDVSVNVPESALIDRIRNGLPGETVITLARKIGVAQKDVAGWLHTTTRTLQRHIETRQNLSPEISDRVAQLVRVYCRCNEVFKDEEKVSAWLKAPNYALGGVVPTTLLDTIPGIELVLDELGRIEHGVFV
jgi:putative toxin-antitoxin system antitoxin component (TIGR02293 family)